MRKMLVSVEMDQRLVEQAALVWANRTMREPVGVEVKDFDLSALFVELLREEAERIGDEFTG